jgi:hypothetical protein
MPTLSFRGQTNSIIDFVFGELRNYLGRTPTLHNLRQIQLVVEPADRDGFEFRIDRNTLQIIGANGRSCLYGAYALLEAQGWRFPVPGQERFEQGSFRAAAWRQLHGKTEASFQFRGLSILSFSNEEVAAVIDWMGKQRLNSIFLGHAGESEQVKALLVDIEQRGIRVEVGGHVLDEFLPLELFQQHPEYFRMQGGQRREDGNFCTNNPETLKIVVENALKFVREIPAAQVFHFWPEDVTGGSWCECDACKGLSAAEQLLRAVNAIADGLAQERPGAAVDFILYHDTLELSETMQPRPNVFALYAPRERCYTHGIGDTNCAHNAWYASRLTAARQPFNGRMSVFEYYCDFILWRCLGIAVPTTITADLPWYKSLGIDQVQALHFGQFSNWAYPLNAFAFARASWDLTLKRDVIATQFCHARYGEHSRAMLQAYFSFEQVSLAALTYDGYGKDAYDLRDTPSQPAEFAQKHITLVEQAVVHVETALSKLPAVNHRVIGGEKLLLELTRDNLRALAHQMRGLQFEKESAEPDRAEKMKVEYDAAIALLEDLHKRLVEVPREYTGAWAEKASEQFKMIADLLRAAKDGKRNRTW